jgi:hypothetical protein
MASYRGALYAATSAWRVGLHRSDDAGRTWRVVYDHPTAPRAVTRITTLATSGDVLYAGLTADESGVKLLRWAGDTLRPVDGWPKGAMVDVLASYRDRLYGVNGVVILHRPIRNDECGVRNLRRRDSPPH